MKRRRSQAGASVDEKTPDSILATEPQTSTSGARLDQGGKTQGPTVPSQDGMQPRKRKRRGSGKGKQSAKTSEVIARLHTLRKQAAATEDPRERKRLEAEEAALGGLSAYQDVSRLVFP